MAGEISQANPAYFLDSANAVVADPSTPEGLRDCVEAEKVLETIDLWLDSLNFDGPRNTTREVPEDGIPVVQHRLTRDLPPLPDGTCYTVHFVVQHHRDDMLTQLLLTDGALLLVDLNRLLPDGRAPFSDSAQARIRRLVNNIWTQNFDRLAWI